MLRWAWTERWEGKGRLKSPHHLCRASLRLLMASMAWKLTNSLPIFRIRQTATLKGTGMLISLYLRSTPSLLPADEVVAIMFRYHTLKGHYLKQGCLGVIEERGWSERSTRHSQQCNAPAIIDWQWAGLAGTDACLTSTITKNFLRS